MQPMRIPVGILLSAAPFTRRLRQSRRLMFVVHHGHVILTNGGKDELTGEVYPASAVFGERRS